jgi:hypothetical protein
MAVKRCTKQADVEQADTYWLDNLHLFLPRRNASTDAMVRQILNRQLWRSDVYSLLPMWHVDYIWKSEQIVQHHNVCYFIF